MMVGLPLAAGRVFHHEGGQAVARHVRQLLAKICFTVSASCALALPTMLGCRIAAPKAAANQAAVANERFMSSLLDADYAAADFFTGWIDRMLMARRFHRLIMPISMVRLTVSTSLKCLRTSS